MKIDTTAVKNNVDLRIIADPFTTLSGKGQSRTGPCPKCKGHDRFVVYSDRFLCRQCHPRYGDAIEFYRWYYGEDFLQAIARLDPAAVNEPIRPKPKPSKKKPKKKKSKKSEFKTDYTNPLGTWFYNAGTLKKTKYPLVTATGAPTGKKTYLWDHHAKNGWEPTTGEITPELFHVQTIQRAAPGSNICYPEGEPDTENLEELGYLATTKPGTAYDIDPYLKYLAGHKIIMFEDNDQAGRNRTKTDMPALIAAGCKVGVITPALGGWSHIDGGDVSDWIAEQRANGATDNEIRAKIDVMVQKVLPADENEPVFRPGLSEFEKNISLDEYHRIIKHRQKHGTAAAWLETVQDCYPALCLATEKRRKLDENRLKRTGNCGRWRVELLATGERKISKMPCGVCENCSKMDAGNLRRKLESIMFDTPGREGSDITLYRPDTAADWHNLRRRLNDNDVLWQCYPVKEYDGDEFSHLEVLAMCYDPDNGEVLDPVLLTEPRLIRWLDTPHGKKKRGDLIGNVRDLRREQNREKWECSPDTPGAVEIECRGIFDENGSKFAPDMPNLDPLEKPVTTLAELQEQLHADHLELLEKLQRENPLVVYGVSTNLFYTPKTTIDILIAEFNANRVRQPEPEPAQMALI